MTVIRAPDDDDDLDDGVLQAEATESGVSKAVGRSIKYIKRVLGMKAARKRRKPRRPPPGFRPSRNPFFNFLRYLQVELKGHSAAAVAQEGGRRWRAMSGTDKEPYRRMARKAPKHSRSPRSQPASRSQKASRSRSRSRSRAWSGSDRRRSPHSRTRGRGGTSRHRGSSRSKGLMSRSRNRNRGGH